MKTIDYHQVIASHSAPSSPQVGTDGGLLQYLEPGVLI